jgi:hypothetical protein
MCKQVLELLYTVSTEIELIFHAKPSFRPAEFSQQERTGKEILIQNSRYKTKIRHDSEVGDTISDIICQLKDYTRRKLSWTATGVARYMGIP